MTTSSKTSSTAREPYQKIPYTLLRVWLLVEKHPIRLSSIPKANDRSSLPKIQFAAPEKENNAAKNLIKRKEYFQYIPFTGQSTRKRIYTFIDLDHMKCGGTNKTFAHPSTAGVMPSIKYGNIDDLRVVLRGINPNVNSMAQKNISMLLGIKIKKKVPQY